MNDDAYIIASVLSPRSVNVLKRYGIETIDQIKASYPEELVCIKGFGLRSLRAVEAAFFPGKEYKPRWGVVAQDGKKSALSEELAQYLRGRPFSNYDGLR
ncbi:hypothetical protein ABIE32_003183 [Comamonas sp. 4034]